VQDRGGIVSGDMFKFLNENLKKAQDKLAEKEVFELNDDNYNEYAEFILNSYKDNVNIKCIKSKCRYCYEHMFMSSALVCKLNDSTFAKDADKDCIIDSHIRDLERHIELLKKYKNFIQYKGRRF
jgi:hypothetical protein